MSIKAGFKYFDTFGLKPTLNIYGESSSKSHIGGLLSIGTYTIALMIIVLEMIAVFTNSQPSLSQFVINKKIESLGNTSLLDYNYDISYHLIS